MTTSEYLAKRNTRPIDETTRGNLQRAREIRIANHYHRKRRLDCLRDGHLTLAEFREERLVDPRLNCLRVRHVVWAAVGKRRGNRFMRELDLDPDKKISRLGPAQWHRLIGRIDSAHRAR